MKQLRYSILSVSFVFLLMGDCLTGEDRIELNTMLMKSTFKLKGDEGSFGTAFVLGKATQNDPDKLYPVLITANHVLDNATGDSVTVFLRKQVGVNYQKVVHRLQIRSEGKPLWVKHPIADVAAIALHFPQGVNLDLLSSDQLLAGDEVFRRLELHPGDELLCLGYPFGAEANQAGFPILRSGKIASFPIIPSKETGHFLLDFEVFEGNSGGPVYFIQSGRIYGEAFSPGQTIIFIAGIISKQLKVIEPREYLNEETLRHHPLRLAVILHASFIRETIELLPAHPD